MAHRYTEIGFKAVLIVQSFKFHFDNKNNNCNIAIMVCVDFVFGIFTFSIEYGLLIMEYPLKFPSSYIIVQYTCICLNNTWHSIMEPLYNIIVEIVLILHNVNCL